jgi:hypothetical protein
VLAETFVGNAAPETGVKKYELALQSATEFFEK